MSPGQADNGSLSRSGQSVIGTGYRFITERYIRPVSPRQVAMAGLKALHVLDPALNADLQGNRVIVRKSDRVVALLPAPAHDDPYRWASTTVNVFLAAQSASPKVRGAGAEVIYKAVFSSALASLDKYSRYLSAAEARDSRAWREGYGGIGITIRSEKGSTLVVSVMPNTPAERAGVKSNDTIVGIGGQAINGWTLRQVVTRLRGPCGSTVRLTLQRQSRRRPFDLRVRRRYIIPNTVRFRREGNIAYISITRFSTGTERHVAKAVRQAQREIGAGLAGIILDLRNNPGGLLDQAIVISDLFLSRGRIVVTRGRHPESYQRYAARSRDMTSGVPMVVLINGRSASSSEIVAAALQDNGRAVIVGSNSFGKGTVQSVTALPNRGEMILTWSRFHAPSGYTLQDLGVLPNLCTSLGKSDATNVVGRLRRSGVQGSYAFRRWRQAAVPSPSRQRALRKLCPATVDSGQGDVDLEVARRLLANQALYRQALRLSAPRLAKAPHPSDQSYAR